jgi:uncharacterized protein (DUF433 family)
VKTAIDTGTKILPITSDPDVLGGTTVFAGTRVPVRTLFEYLEDGYALDIFLKEFPSVRRRDAIALLEAASDTFLKAMLSQ